MKNATHKFGMIAGWHVRRGLTANRDWYLTSSSGAQAAIWKCGSGQPYYALVPGGICQNGFPTRRDAFAFILAHGLAAYEIEGYCGHEASATVTHITVYAAPPSAETVKPWQGAKAFHASRDAAKADLEAQPKKQRTASHIRAIMAYLKFRERRFNADCDYITALTCVRSAEARERNWKVNFEAAQKEIAKAERQRDQWKDHAISLAVKPRRAILTARDFQQRLYAEHELVDRNNAKHWEARDKMGARIAELEAQIDAAPVRRLMPRCALNGASVFALAIAA